MDGIVGITGTPGTGKKTVAPLVAESLGIECLALNDIALSLGVLEAGEYGVVDTARLRKKLSLRNPAVVYGHLLPYSIKPDAVSGVAVLRCEPRVLKKRLAERGYSMKKLADNLEAELIGLESSDAFDAFGPVKTFEVDTTRLTPDQSAERVVAMLRKPPTGSRIDWMRAYDTGAKLRSLLSGPER